MYIFFVGSLSAVTWHILPCGNFLLASNFVTCLLIHTGHSPSRQEEPVPTSYCSCFCSLKAEVFYFLPLFDYKGYLCFTNIQKTPTSHQCNNLYGFKIDCKQLTRALFFTSLGIRSSTVMQSSH